MVLPKLKGILPSLIVNISRSAAFSEITLADPKFDVSGRVDILIGGEIYPSVMLERDIFCWVLTVSLPEPRSQCHTTLVKYGFAYFLYRFHSSFH